MAGDSCRSIASMFATSKDAVYRHKNGCMMNMVSAPITVQVPAYQTSTDVAIVKQTATTALQRVSGLIDVLERQASECSDDKDRRNMTGTAGALLKALELNARLTGELLPGNMVNVQVNNNVTITDNEKEVVLKVVQRHPEIYSEILTAMVEAGL